MWQVMRWMSWLQSSSAQVGEGTEVLQETGGATVGVPSCTGHLIALLFLHFKKVSNENTISVFCRRRFTVHAVRVHISPSGLLTPAFTRLNISRCNYPIPVGFVLAWTSIYGLVLQANSAGMKHFHPDIFHLVNGMM